MEKTSSNDPNAIICRLYRGATHSTSKNEIKSRTYKYPASKACPTKIPGAYCMKYWKLPIQLSFSSRESSKHVGQRRYRDTLYRRGFCGRENRVCRCLDKLQTRWNTCGPKIQLVRGQLVLGKLSSLPDGTELDHEARRRREQC